MISPVWSRLLPRGLNVTAVFILTVFCAPLVIWMLLLKVWCGWSAYAGRDGLIPVNWTFVAAAVFITWFLHWFICRKRA